MRNKKIVTGVFLLVDAKMTNFRVSQLGWDEERLLNSRNWAIRHYSIYSRTTEECERYSERIQTGKLD